MYYNLKFALYNWLQMIFCTGYRKPYAAKPIWLQNQQNTTTTDTMKKLLTVIALLATAHLAFGSFIKDAVIAKILAIKAEAFITPKFITKVIDSRESNFGTTTCGFYEAYYMCRARTYDLTFVGENANDSESSTVGWGNYLQFRTVMVARMKEQLHAGDTLAKVYANCQSEFIKTVSQQGPQFQENLHAMLHDAVAAFEAVTQESRRKGIMQMIIKDERDRSDNSMIATIESMLAQNRPADEIAQKIKVDVEPIDEKDLLDAGLNDLDLAKFALRRWNEGGDALIEKYLVVLRQAEHDVKGIRQK